jgi:predicted MFS family arabinose efflux permease
MAIIGDVFPENRRGRATGALMMSFSMASILGVPIGLALGQRYGWHIPFFLIVALGLPIVALAIMVMPKLDEHLARRSTASYLLRQWHTLQDVNNLKGFALTVAMQFGTFAVVTFLAAYMVSNVHIAEEHLPFAYIVGGVLALVGSPIVGRISDRIGKPPVYRVMATASAIVMLVVTNLPPLPLIAAVFIMGSLMLTNAGRMVPAMAMLTSSVPPERRGSFLTINSAVQHLSSGLGASVAGMILSKSADGQMIGYGWVGLLGAVTTIGSIFIANQLKIYVPPPPSTIEETIAAAATTADTGTEIPVAVAK